jgi:hypothetical protein
MGDTQGTEEMNDSYAKTMHAGKMGRVSMSNSYTVRSMIKLNTTVTSRLPAGTATIKLGLLFLWCDT